MNTQKIMVGCILAKHKTLAFDYFWNSLMSQTVKEFTIIFVYSDRVRFTDLQREEIVRARDMGTKLQTLWSILRRIPDWKYYWTVSSDTWYPPNSLEMLLKIMQEKKANCVFQRVKGNYYRGAFNIGHEIPWGLMPIPAEASILYDRKTIETIFPRFQAEGDVVVTHMVFRNQDIEEAGLVKVWMDESCVAWHLHHYNDPLPGDNRVAIPEFLKKRR